MMNSLKVYRKLEREPKIAGLQFVEFFAVLLVAVLSSILVWALIDRIAISIVIFSSLLLSAIFGKRYLDEKEIDVWDYFIYNQPFPSSIINLVDRSGSVGYGPFFIKTKRHDEK